jgi:rhodanese-related sulfurtransferase
MRKFSYLFLIVLTFLACKDQSAPQTANENVPVQSDAKAENIDVAAAKQLLSSRTDLVLIDVRTPEEIAGGKINNALEIDFSSPEFAAKIEALDKQTPYMVYCAAGGRSARAMEQMQQMGFREVYNLMDGYTGWSQAK